MIFHFSLFTFHMKCLPLSCKPKTIILMSTPTTFAIRNNIFDVGVMLVFGLIGFILKKAGFAAPPMILGMVLSEICESNWRRAVILAGAKGGMLNYFLGRPIAIVLAVLIVASLFSPVIMKIVNKKAHAIEKQS